MTLHLHSSFPLRSLKYCSLIVQKKWCQDRGKGGREMCFLIVLGNWEILNFNTGFKPRQWGCVYTSEVVCEISQFFFREQMYLQSHFKKFTEVYVSQSFPTWGNVFLLPMCPTLGKFGSVLPQLLWGWGTGRSQDLVDRGQGCAAKNPTVHRITPLKRIIQAKITAVPKLESPRSLNIVCTSISPVFPEKV